MLMTNKKGFTLAELLIVIAIISVLVGIMFPAFGGSLEKSKEAVDAANIRDEYAELMTDVSLSGKDSKYWEEDKGIYISTDVKLTQTKDGWQNDTIKTSLDKIATQLGTPLNTVVAHIEYDDTNDTTTIVYGDGQVVYTDSKEVQEAKQKAQNMATLTLEKLKQTLTSGYGSDKTVWKTKLDPIANAKFTLTVEGKTVTAYYKTSPSQIDSMDHEKAGDNKYWANFTLDENGNIIIFNYVDPNYSYSTYDSSKQDAEWIGSAVIK